jgi:methyltransferase (TIGR00027 family)
MEQTMRRSLREVAGVLALAIGGRAVEPGTPSLTALTVAAQRAIGARCADPLLRNPDFLAEKFLGPDVRAVLAKRSPRISRELDMDYDDAVRSILARDNVFYALLVRTKYIDTELKKSLDDGAEQVVILGAGLDSRAYRFTRELRRATVFEVDFPPTQEFKKNCVRGFLGELPANVAFVPIDFSKQDLATVLAGAGCREDRKTFFIWEGVSMYIPQDAVDATLRFVATRSAPGSRIIFDYMLESSLKSPRVANGIQKSLIAIGEPWIFGFPGRRATEYVLGRGLQVIGDPSPDELAAKYLRASDGHIAGRAGRMCLASRP